MLFDKLSFALFIDKPEQIKEARSSGLPQS